MMWKLALIFATILGSAFFVPQIFAFDGQTTVWSNGQPTVEVLDQKQFTIETNETANEPFLGIELPKFEPKAIIEWLVDVFTRASNFLGDILTTYIRKILPTASGMLGTLVIAMLALLVIYLKAESVSSIIRIATLVGMGVLSIALVLSIMGII